MKDQEPPQQPRQPEGKPPELAEVISNLNFLISRLAMAMSGTNERLYDIIGLNDHDTPTDDFLPQYEVSDPMLDAGNREKAINFSIALRMMHSLTHIGDPSPLIDQWQNPEELKNGLVLVVDKFFEQKIGSSENSIVTDEEFSHLFDAVYNSFAIKGMRIERMGQTDILVQVLRLVRRVHANLVSIAPEIGLSAGWSKMNQSEFDTNTKQFVEKKIKMFQLFFDLQYVDVASLVATVGEWRELIVRGKKSEEFSGRYEFIAAVDILFEQMVMTLVFGLFLKMRLMGSKS